MSADAREATGKERFDLTSSIAANEQRWRMHDKLAVGHGRLWNAVAVVEETLTTLGDETLPTDHSYGYCCGRLHPPDMNLHR